MNIENDDGPIGTPPLQPINESFRFYVCWFGRSEYPIIIEAEDLKWTDAMELAIKVADDPDREAKVHGVMINDHDNDETVFRFVRGEEPHIDFSGLPESAFHVSN